MANISLAEIQYQEANIHDNRSAALYGVGIGMFVATTIAVVSRIICKRSLKAKLTSDDYMIMLALILIYGLCVELILCTIFGGGKHALAVPLQDQVHVLQIIWIFEANYALATTTIKTSILIFYRHMFPSNATSFFWRIAWYFVLIWVLTWLVACGLVSVFQCSPVPFLWNQLTGDTSGSCIDEYSFLAANSALNIASDIMILMLPMPIVWHLHIQNSQKLAISSIFLLGGFVCIASVVRYTYLKEVVPVDVTYTNVLPGIWSLIELSTGLICACLPAMRPLLRYLVPPFVRTLAESFDTKSSSRNKPYTHRRQASTTRSNTTPSNKPSRPVKESTRDDYDMSIYTTTSIHKIVSSSSVWSGSQTQCDIEKGVPRAHISRLDGRL
ncbi:hypothetical protein MMC17_006041 [Xylographa soralifera]|nr:hypothetical protein [Xylographa soralifera]